MQVVRTETEIARVENWAVEGIDESTHYPGMSYEQGIVDVLAWLRGDNETAPRGAVAGAWRLRPDEQP